MALHDDQVVIPIRRYHHVVDLAGDSQESQVILRVQVTHQTPGRYRELGETNGIGGGLLGLAHRRAHDLRLVAFLHLRLLDNDEAFDALVRFDSGDPLFDFTLCYNLKAVRLLGGSNASEGQRQVSNYDYLRSFLF